MKTNMIQERVEHLERQVKELYELLHEHDEVRVALGARDVFRQIAALVATLPHGIFHCITLGSSAEAVDLLRALPGARPRAHVNNRAIAIEAVSVEIDGLTFEAQISRPATPEEMALLDGDTATTGEAYRSASLGEANTNGRKL